jgi:B12-binding domain/radical SAM domain protein
VFKTDILFLHAPSVYDFRKHKAVFGPIADVIPSTNVFEMYPVGLTSIAEYLEGRGYRAQLINLAYRMLSDAHYDVEKTIAKSKARFFALDLHWLPHAHGSIEIARLIKKYHPQKPVIMGGLTASYYHRELVQYDCVDYVLRGDSVEEPCCCLLNALSGNGDLAQVPNLTYKDINGLVKENELSHVPSSINYVSIPSYQYVVSSILRYGSIHNPMPYMDWVKYPMTMLLTSRGCTYNCAICGGGREAYKKICARSNPAFRSPAKLIEDVRTITSFTKAPIFVVHDLRQGGSAYANEFLDRLSRENVENEFVFELFRPAGDEFLGRLQKATAKYSLQVSVETQSESIRSIGGKFSRYSNEDINNTMRAALRNGCQKIDLFFIIGLPRQSYEDAVGCVDYSRHLLKELRDEFGSPCRVVPYAAPYAPFLDPGSAIYEDPDKYGYTKLWSDLESYRTALLAPSWKYMLNYETKWMNRDQIVAATYDTATGFNELKYEMGLIEEKDYQAAKAGIVKSEMVMAEIDEIVESTLGCFPRTPIAPALASEILAQLHSELDIDGTEFILCGKEEMRWPIRRRFSSILSLLRLGLRFTWQTLMPPRRSSRLRRKDQAKQAGSGLTNR